MGLTCIALVAAVILGIAAASRADPVNMSPAEIMAVGLDGKFAYEDGKRFALEPGHDTVLFYELKNPAKPEKIGEIALENSIVGPPTNIAITPDQHLALIANSMHSEPGEGGKWKAVPADEVFAVDLTARPVTRIATLKVGRQPSGIAINKTGTLALVANRDSKSISVLSINGNQVSVTDTIDMTDSVGAVAITPDGRHAVATKTLTHKVSVLAISAEGKVTIERDLWAGLFPWNAAITPNGALALVNNNGNAGQSDGNADTVSVVDLQAQPPRVIEHVSVGDAPEGISIRPQGDLAALALLAGSYDSPNAAWYRRDAGKVQLLRINGKKVSALQSLDVGSFPEGIAFSKDGHFIYAGNFASNSVSILSVSDEGTLTDTGATIALPGSPASLRIGSR
jgi:DNA-binding beta-propeller fold protein YncE